MKPNIVLITVDCWRGDHLSAIDPTHVETPCLDRLAQEGVLFTNAYTCGGWTRIAMTSLFSSTYPSMFDFCGQKFPGKRPVLADILKQHGYQTTGFTTNPVCGSSAGFAYGFDTFVELKPDMKLRGLEKVQNVRVARSRLYQQNGQKWLSRLGGVVFPKYPSTTAEMVVDQAIDWLRQPHHTPYFLWLHFMEPHWPYRLSQRDITPREASESWLDRRGWREMISRRGWFNPGEIRANRWKRLYAEEVQTLDREIGRFNQFLNQHEEDKNTLVVVTGDHGEEQQEHGSWAHSWNQLHHEGAHVPLIMRLPQEENKGRVINQAVSHIDLTPTMLDFAGIEQRSSKMVGNSLRPLLDGDKQDAVLPVYTEMMVHAGSYQYRLAIRHGSYTYIYDADTKKAFLYDLDTDPDEQYDIYSEQPEVARQFDTLRLAHIQKGLLAVHKNKTEPILLTMLNDEDDDPELLARLEALGYIE